MQKHQEEKEQAAHKNLFMLNIKLLGLGLLFLFFGLHVKAQQKSKDSLLQVFKQSFTLTCRHPSSLIENCTPVMCMLKITMKEAAIDKMTLSDSADPIFKTAFENSKAMINYTSFLKYCSKTGLKNGDIIIPIFYGLRKTSCPEPKINFPNLAHYSDFEGVALNGNFTILPAISIESTLRIN